MTSAGKKGGPRSAIECLDIAGTASGAVDAGVDAGIVGAAGLALVGVAAVPAGQSAAASLPTTRAAL